MATGDRDMSELSENIGSYINPEIDDYREENRSIRAMALLSAGKATIESQERDIAELVEGLINSSCGQRDCTGLVPPQTPSLSQCSQCTNRALLIAKHSKGDSK